MSKFECSIYMIIAWLPIVSIVVGVISVIVGAILKRKGLTYKYMFIIGGVFLAIFLLCLVALVIMGLIGVGPGRFD